MPYIPEGRREELNEGYPVLNVGELTFVITDMLKRYWVNSSKRYQNIAEILGALEGSKADFIDHVVKPYEAEKEKINGSIW